MTVTDTAIQDARRAAATAAAGIAETTPSPSPAGPVGDEVPIRMPPRRPYGRYAQTFRFISNPLGSSLAARRDFGDVWQLHLLSRREPFIATCHPDHLRSLFTAAPQDAPSLTGESPLRPIVGPNSVLTAIGERHMRQRKLLLPQFHGEAVQRYIEPAAPRDPTPDATTSSRCSLEARDEDGVALTDRELRDELMTLVLAGHETTANSLAWTFERLLRTPAAYDRLREQTRAGDDSYVEATVNEGMRNRPVVPMIVRMVKRRWQLGDCVVPAGTPVAVSIAALHHREDVYPDPLVFRPERFVGRRPATYTWIPFGGGIRRCLGATLAMAEQHVVLRAIARRTDLAAPDPAPEHARQRNVTMIPDRGGRVLVVSKRRT
jgi:cytochrome P450